MGTGRRVYNRDMSRFRKRLESTQEQRKALQWLEQAPHVRALVPAITAVSCGVLPLGTEDGSDPSLAPDVPLFLAAFPSVHADVPLLLSRAMHRPVECVDFEPSLVIGAIEKFYMCEGGLNLQTFEHPDFLLASASAPKILHEKVEDLPTVHWHPHPETLTLIDLSLHSILTNLDGNDTTDLTSTSADFAFKFLDEKPLIFLDEPLAEDAGLLVQRSFLYDGCEHVHGFGGEPASNLPYVLHPSEVQIVGLADSGAVTIHLYDHTVTLPPGERGTFEIEYHYLRHGMRYHRRIVVAVHGVWRARRETLVYADYERHAEAEDLERLFGLEFAP